MVANVWQLILVGIFGFGLSCGAWSCSTQTPAQQQDDAEETGREMPGGCGAVGSQGCCSGGLLIWCDQGELKETNCAGKPLCGWNPQVGGYDCDTDGATDPAGIYPLACAGSAPMDISSTDGIAGIDVQADSNLPDPPDAVSDDGGPEEDSDEADDLGPASDLLTVDQGCVPSCFTPQGDIMACGPNGCGGSCGSCPPGIPCVDGICPCQPSCSGQECGADGCGGSCGECNYGVCSDGLCICEPACNGKDCGSDGCSGSCGTCPANDVCQGGNCVPAGTCTPQFQSEDVLKIVKLDVAQGGVPGKALDVDGDPNTCAPAGACSNGLDNQLGGLLGQLEQFVDLNAEFQTFLEGNADSAYLAELVGFNAGGVPFTMNMFRGVAVQPKDLCDWQTEKCEYLAKQSDFDPVDCLPYMSFDNAVVVYGQLQAGGAGYKVRLTLFLAMGVSGTVDGHMAAVVGNLEIVDGHPVALHDAVLGVAVRKSDIMTMIDLIPEDAELPVSKDMIKNLLDMFVSPDIDADGDGQMDSASLGLQHDAIAGSIAGVTSGDGE